MMMMTTATPLAGCRIATRALHYSRGIGRRLRRRHFHCVALPSQVCHSHDQNPSTLCSASSSGHQVFAEPSSVRKSSQAAERSAPNEKLARLRELFTSYNIHAYVVPSEDAHQSEFLADCFNRRAYISEFTGSAGTAVITLEKAALWTDGRYFLQAERQLGPEWILMRGGTVGVPSYSEWLRDNLPPGSSVGIDPFLFTSEGAEELKRTICEKDLKLAYVQGNLVDRIWGESRPSPPSASVRVHQMKYAGVDVSTKIAALRKELSAAGATAIAVSTLDEVAWLFNIRGGDVPRCPVAYAYALIELEKATLFIDLSKVTPDVMDYLCKSSVVLKPYDSLLSEITRLALSGAKLWLDPAKANMAIVKTFSEACEKYYTANKKRKEKSGGQTDGPAALFRPSPLALSKAIKNEAEIMGIKQAHLRDAAALTEFWAWLEEKIVDEKVKLSEVEVADTLLTFRSKQEGFLDTSFDTICGAGENGAIIHYRAEPDSCALVDNTSLLLLDSGAQYIDGTTDITRTVHFGVPTEYQKECFTRVLKGHIALDEAVFPENTPGFVLDVFARSSLWKIGLDYRHGTGHGVGAALNVHEGPHSISFRFGNMTPLQPGMIVSNEPGYYEDHKFGIRIENLLHVCERDTPNRYGGTTFLGFEQLSYVPIQRKLMAVELMSPEEISWVNAYHGEVWNKVSPLVEGNALKWLRENTAPIASERAHP